MAVRFNAAADRLLRTTNTLATGADWTVTFWVYLSSDTDAFAAFMYLGTNNYSGDYLFVGTNTTGTTLYTEVTGVSDTGTNLSVATWYHIGVTFTNSSGTIRIYLNGVQDATVTGISLNNTRWEFGAVGTSNLDPLDGRIAYIKRFDGVALTAEQISAERRTVRPVYYSSLAGWYPTLSGSQRLRDLSRNRYDFTAGGALTDEAPPAVPFGGGGVLFLPAVVAGGPASQTLSPDSVNLDTTVGAPTLSGGTATLSPAGLDLGTTVGAPSITTGATLSPDGTDLNTAVGQPALSLTLTPDGQDLDTAVGIIDYQGGYHYALRFFGTGADDIDRIKIPVQNAASAGTLMDIGATDFTIEWKMRCGASDNNTGTINRWIDGHIIFDRDIFGDVDQSFGISMADGDLQFGSGSSIFTIATSGASVDNNAWHDVAAQRTASTGLLEIYVDGQRAASGNDNALADISYPHGYWDAANPNNPYLVIGAEKHDAGPSFPSYNGLVANVRVSTTRRYSGSYTPSTQPFAMDASTVGLYVWPQDSPADDLTFNHADLTSGSSHGQVFFGGDTGASGPIWVVSDHFNNQYPDGIDLATTVGQPTLTSTFTLSPDGVDLDTTVGAPTITTGAATLSPAGIDLNTTVGQPTLNVTLAPDSVDLDTTVGQPTLTSTVTLAPAGTDLDTQVGSPTLTVTLAPDGTDLDTTVGQPTLSGGTATLSPNGTDLDTTVGQPTFQITIAPDSIDLDTTVGQPALSATATLSPNGVDLDTAVGSPSLAMTLLPDSVDLATTVGSPTLTAQGSSIAPDSVNLDTTVGQATLSAGAVTLAPAGVDLDTTVGQPTLTTGATLIPDSVDLATTVGAASLSAGTVTLSPAGIDLETEVSDLTLTPGTVTLTPLGIDLGTKVGAIAFKVYLAPTGLDLDTTVGQAALTPAAVTLAPAGIDLNTVVGAPSLVLFVLVYQTKISGTFQTTVTISGEFYTQVTL